MRWIMIPMILDTATDVGLLDYSEAMLFSRAGFDVRRASWPAGQFVREAPTLPRNEGYAASPYRPTLGDRIASNWRRA